VRPFCCLQGLYLYAARSTEHNELYFSLHNVRSHQVTQNYVVWNSSRGGSGGRGNVGCWARSGVEWRQTRYETPNSQPHVHSEYVMTLIFIGPRTVIYCYSTTNKMQHLLSQIVYSCKTLYVFRTVFPSIIRSSKLRIQQRYMSNSCCYLLLWVPSHLW
jgi:hypothetical protein